MRIGLEVSNVVTPTRTGISRYTIELVSALASQVEVQDCLTLFYKLSCWKHRKAWWHPAGLARRTYYKGWWPPSKDVDIMHSLDCALPSWRGVKHLVTLHDLLVMQADDGIASAAFRKKRCQLYRTAAAGADAIITVSVTTRQDVTQQLGVPEERVHVVYLGVDQHFAPQRPEAVHRVLRHYQLSPGYLLFVGAISGRKNTARLVQAYAQSRAHTERSLVLVGALSYRSADTIEAIRQYRPDKHIRLLGYVPDEDFRPCMPARLLRFPNVGLRGAALDVVHLGARVGDDQRVLEGALVGALHAEVGLERKVDLHVLRHVQERAA